MSEQGALKAVTLNAAEMLHLDGRLGSIEPRQTRAPEREVLLLREGEPAHRVHYPHHRQDPVARARHHAHELAFMADRMKRVIAEDKPTLVGADEKKFSEALCYHDRDVQEELAIMQDDRAKLAVELDGAAARVKTLELANDEATRKLAHAMAEIRAVLAQVADREG